MKYVIVLFVLVFFNSSVWAETYQLQKTKGKVEFFAKGWPSLLKIHGTGEGVEGNLDLVDGVLQGDLSFDLKTLKTGIDLRDRHLKENYLKVKEEGRDTAVLRIESLKLPKSLKGGVKFKAKLKLNLIEKEVVVKAKLKPTSKGFSVKGSFEFKLTDFGVEIPSFKGITVAEKIKVVTALSAVTK